MSVKRFNKKLSMSLIAGVLSLSVIVPCTIIRSTTKVIAEQPIAGESTPTENIFDQYKQFEIDTVTPQGTVINLFDYWYKANRFDKDEEHTTDKINAGHVLQFYNQQNSPDGKRVNNWQGHYENLPLFKMVEPGLGEQGYPTLNYKEHQDYGITSAESLEYLFNPNFNHEGKISYTNVKDLLSIDEEGYFKYNSSENFASYDEKNNRFSVYNTPAVDNSTAVADRSGNNFFPFNTPDHVFDVQEGTGLVKKPVEVVNQSSPIINHGLGLTMTTRFIQSKNGRNLSNKPITYEFKGDDDVLVFIDDVLVGDLSGIHDKASLIINFETGKIDIEVIRNGKSYKHGTNLKAEFERYNAFYGDTKLKDIDTIFKENTSAGEGCYTFTDESYHTLKLFYLERGGYASNLHLRFNMKTVPDTDIYKIDETGKALPEVEFELYKTSKDFNVDANALLLSKGVTDDFGHILFTHSDDPTKVVDFDELHKMYGNQGESDYYVLRETKGCDGYRKADDIKLTYKLLNNDRGYLITEHKHSISSGAFASPKVIISAPQEIELVDGEKVNLNDNNGQMYAVILAKTDKGWAPVSGDPVGGWTLGTSMIEGGNIDSSLHDAIVKNPYKAILSGSGAYEIHIENMPGNLDDYYWVKNMHNQNTESAKYTVGFYYRTDMDGSEYKRVSNFSNNMFERYFSSNIYVSNPKNKLIVQKMDSKGNLLGNNVELDSLQNATFSLYKADEKWENLTLYDTLKINQETPSKGDLNMNHVAVFPSQGKLLTNGNYVLREEVAPAGYNKLNKDIKVVVTDKGVYADAGVRHDGVHVLNGVGYLFKSLAQFGTGDVIDSTLSHIRVNQLIKNDNSIINNLDDNTAYTEISDSLHLKYQKNNTLSEGVYLNYVSETLGGKVLWNNDIGFAKVKIYQCNDSEHRKQGYPYVELGDEDITNAFSLSTVVQVMDQPIIKGVKTLEGREIQSSDVFKFVVKPWDFVSNKETSYLELGVIHPQAVVLYRETGEFTYGDFSLADTFDFDGENKSTKTFDYLIEEENTKIENIQYDKTKYKLSLVVTKFNSQHHGIKDLPENATKASYTIKYQLFKQDANGEYNKVLDKQGNELLSTSFVNKYSTEPIPSVKPDETGPVTPPTVPPTQKPDVEPTPGPSVSPVPSVTPEPTKDPGSPMPENTPKPSSTPGSNSTSTTVDSQPKPNTSNNTHYLDKTPNTADNSKMTIWLGLMGVSIVGIVCSVIYKKKKNK